MADFETWERRNLVQFAQEAEPRLAQLARLQELEEQLEALQAEMDADRRMLLDRWREVCRRNEELLLRNSALERKGGLR